jgi:hypothetical protein
MLLSDLLIGTPKGRRHLLQNVDIIGCTTTGKLTPSVP